METTHFIVEVAIALSLSMGLDAIFNSIYIATSKKTLPCIAQALLFAISIIIGVTVAVIFHIWLDAYLYQYLPIIETLGG